MDKNGLRFGFTWVGRTGMQSGYIKVAAIMDARPSKSVFLWVVAMIMPVFRQPWFSTSRPFSSNQLQCTVFFSRYAPLNNTSLLSHSRKNSRLFQPEGNTLVDSLFCSGT
jgi:hypothetical protein